VIILETVSVHTKRHVTLTHINITVRFTPPLNTRDIGVSCHCGSTAFSIGGPNKGVQYTRSGFRGQCPQRGLWLFNCHITNSILIFRAAGGIICTEGPWIGTLSWRWAWLLFILQLLECIMSSLSESITISRILFLDSRRACFTHETSPCGIFNKTSKSRTSQQNLFTEWSRKLQAAWWYNA
jgi:hypothetical protein